jgi:hypothetical protein
VPGLVGQVIEFRKSGSVPQVESETKRLGDAEGEGPLRLPLAIFRARQCGLVCCWVAGNHRCALRHKQRRKWRRALCLSKNVAAVGQLCMVNRYFLG